MRESLESGIRDLLHKWLLFAVGATGVAGILAVFIAMARVPALQAISPSKFFSAFLVGHVTFSLMISLLAFVAITAIYLGGVFLFLQHAQSNVSSALGMILGSRGSRTVLPGGGLMLSVIGSGLLLSAALAGHGKVVLSDYVPVVETHSFFVGYVFFVGGILLVMGSFLRAVLRHLGRALPLPVYGMCAVIACGMITILALFVGLGTIGSRSYNALFWGAGHALQYVYVGTLAVTWYILAASAYGAIPVAPRASRLAFALYPMLALPIPFLYFLVDPVVLPRMASVNTFLGLGLGLPTLLHALLIFVSVARAVRGEFLTWSGKVWEDPKASALALSSLLFLIGGLLAPVGAQNTLRVTAHYHAMLVGGVTLAFMGLVYHILPAIGRDLRDAISARIQPFIFGLGVLLIVLTLAWAGSQGAPRKTVMAGIGVGVAWSAVLNFMALGAGLATLGGAIFVGSVLRALLPVQVESRAARATQGVGKRRRNLAGVT